MFPGLTTRLSSTSITVGGDNTIDAKTDIVFVTAAPAGVIDTIKPHFGGGQSGVIFIINETDDLLTLTTDGNIQGDLYAILNKKMMPLVYSKESGWWYPIFAVLND